MKTKVFNKVMLTLDCKKDGGLCLESVKPGPLYKMVWLQWHSYFDFRIKHINRFIYVSVGYLSISFQL